MEWRLSAENLFLNNQLQANGASASAQRQYVKSSSEEDTQILKAIQLHGRDASKIVTYIEENLELLPITTRYFYQEASTEQKRQRIYRKIKQLLDTSKTIGQEWVPHESPQGNPQTSDLIHYSLAASAPISPLPVQASSSVAAAINQHDRRYVYPETRSSTITNPSELQRLVSEADAKDSQEAQQLRETDKEPVKKKTCMKDLRKENTKMVNETLRTFPTLMSSMMEMMERQQKEDREFKKLMLKSLKRCRDQSDSD